LSSRIIDKLNEIPEFEISEKTNLTPEQLATEIKNVDAVIMSGTTLMTSAILKDTVNLKIIILTGEGPNHVDTTMARRKKIEIRNTQLAENQERESLDVIVILKDFFNV
jgi:lactate dehydrogenase-like 2-hydroxyacid dehydrogenase